MRPDQPTPRRNPGLRAVFERHPMSRPTDQPTPQTEAHDLQPGVPCRVPGCPGPRAAQARTEALDPMAGTPADGRHPDHVCGQTPCPHIPAAQASTEALDVDALAEALWNLRVQHPKPFLTTEDRAEALAREYAAILAARAV